MGGAHGSTDQWLRKTCCLVTGCRVIRHSNGYFPGGSDGGSYNVGDLGSIPGLGRYPGEGNGNPLKYSCLKILMDGGAWLATVHGVTKTQTQLSNFTSLLSAVLMLLCYIRTLWVQCAGIFLINSFPTSDFGFTHLFNFCSSFFSLYSQAYLSPVIISKPLQQLSLDHMLSL